MEPQTRVTVDAVDLPRLVRFPSILSSITAAMRGSRVLVGLVAIVVLAVAGRAWDGVMPHTISPFGLLAGPMAPEQVEHAEESAARIRANVSTFGDSDDIGSWERSMRIADMTRPKGTFEALSNEIARATYGAVRSTIDLDFRTALDDVWTLVVRTPVALWRASPVFTILYGAFAVVVIGFAGGVLSRLAANDLGAGEQPSLSAARAFIQHRWRHVCFAPLAAGGVALALIVVASVPALLLHVPVLDVVAAAWTGVAIVLILLAGILIALLLLGAPLFIPAASTEACDGTEAVQRVSAMLLTRPLHAALYAGVGLVTFGAGFALVDIALTWSYNTSLEITGLLGNQQVASGAGVMAMLEPSGFSDRSHLSGTSWLAAEVIRAWKAATGGVIAGYAFALFWTIGTRAYLLLRLAADGQSTDGVAADR